MNARDLATRAFRATWANKKLWLFGFFAAAASSGSGGNGGTGGAGSGGGEDLPLWVIVLIVAALVVGLAALAMHIVSEAALIAGFDRARDAGAPSMGLGEGLRVGRRHFGGVLLTKLLVGLATAASVALICAPAALGAIGVVPLWLGAAATALLALPAVPWLLTLHFLLQYALRIVVLEQRPAREAIARAWAYLHGRIRDSLVLLGLSILGEGAAAVAMAICLVPSALVGGLLYLLAGLPAAIAAGVAIFAPCAFAVTGAKGTFRSGLWTLGYLEGGSVHARA
jgi:hypothetical protein